MYDKIEKRSEVIGVEVTSPKRQMHPLIKSLKNMTHGKMRTVWLNLGSWMQWPKMLGHFSFVYLQPRKFGIFSKQLIQSVKMHQRRTNFIVRFLTGLDSHLDGVRGWILATIPLPSIQIVYTNVCVEPNLQEAMPSGTQNEGAAMAMKMSSNSKKENRKCTHCNGTNHIVDTYFKLHGYPEWHPKGKNWSLPRTTPPLQLDLLLS